MAIGDEQQTAMVGLAFCNDQESPDKLNIVICSNFIVHLHYTNIRIYIQYKYEGIYIFWILYKSFPTPYDLRYPNLRCYHLTIPPMENSGCYPICNVPGCCGLLWREWPHLCSWLRSLVGITSRTKPSSDQSLSRGTKENGTGTCEHLLLDDNL